MVDPFGLWAMGMSSARDPDVASRNAASMYMQGSEQKQQDEQFKQQMELRRQAEMRRQQERDLQSRALQAYAKNLGIDEPTISILPNLPEAAQAALIQSKAGTMTPYQQEMVDLKRQDVEAKKTELANKPKPLTKLQEEISKKMATEQSDYNKAMPEINKAYANVKELERLIPETDTSKFDKFVAGVDVFNWGENTKKLQRMDQLTNAAALSNAQGLKGPTSDKDIAFVKDMFANADGSQEANLQAAGAYKAYLDRERDKINKYNDMIADPQYQQNPELFQRDLQNYLASLPPLEDVIAGGAKAVPAETGLPEWATPDKLEAYKKLRGIQ